MALERPRKGQKRCATINKATCCCCLLLYNEIFVGHESTGPWTPAGARRSRRAQERAGQGEREPTPAPTRLHLLPHTATTPTAPAARTPHRCWTRGGAPLLDDFVDRSYHLQTMRVLLNLLTVVQHYMLLLACLLTVETEKGRLETPSGSACGVPGELQRLFCR